MTNPTRYPFIPAQQPYDETRLRHHLRGIKPLTPQVRNALHRVFDRHEEFFLALQQYMRNAAVTGVKDRSRLDKILPEFAQARREALIAIGADPESTELFPAVPVFRHDA